ncbi:PAAR domain-containing protein [Pseudomonas ovata]|uniref:PAAR domain-containing protein n=1 Tax=Pseudomonas ovata TaxID=1839709 RepID=UPI000D6861F8|nr:PAAR domain-containing protein [Pseudomonas ovata]
MIPVSRLTDLHACPIPLHGITPLVSASPTVCVNDLPVARIGDRAACGAVIVSGFVNILVDGRPMAHMGSLTSHGGGLITGSQDTRGGAVNFVTPRLAVDFARLGAIDESGNVDDQKLQALLADPQLEQRALAAGAWVESHDAPAVASSVFTRSFQVTDSETGKPLADRPFIAVVDGEEITGLTDTTGLAHVEAPSADSLISMHVMFKAPARVLDELSKTDPHFTITANAQALNKGQPLVPLPITINDRAATREALIRKVRALGHEFVERSQWHAKPPKNLLEPDWDYSMIALHHAGRSYSCGRGAEQMLETQKTHQSKDFDDISYHYGIDCSGVLYEGRDIRFKASSVSSYNTGVIGIILLNNLTTPEEGKDWVTFARKNLHSLGVGTTHSIPATQADATITLINALKDIFFITRFGGHKEYPNQTLEGKICPGNIGMELVQLIRTKTQLLTPPTS